MANTENGVSSYSSTQSHLLFEEYSNISAAKAFYSFDSTQAARITGNGECIFFLSPSAVFGSPQESESINKLTVFIQHRPNEKKREANKSHEKRTLTNEYRNERMHKENKKTRCKKC